MGGAWSHSAWPGQVRLIDAAWRYRDGSPTTYSGHGSNVHTPKLEFGGSPDGLPELVARVFLWKAWAVPGFASPCWRGEWSRSFT